MPIRIISKVTSFEREKTTQFTVPGTYGPIEEWDDWASGAEYVLPYIWNGKGGRMYFDLPGVYEFSFKIEVELTGTGKTEVWYKLVDDSGDIREWNESYDDDSGKKFTIDIPRFKYVVSDESTQYLEIQVKDVGIGAYINQARLTVLKV